MNSVNRMELQQIEGGLGGSAGLTIALVVGLPVVGFIVGAGLLWWLLD